MKWSAGEDEERSEVANGGRETGADGRWTRREQTLNKGYWREEEGENEDMREFDRKQKNR